MNLLLLDSTKPQLVVALAENDRIIAKEVCDEQRQHDKNINRLIQALPRQDFVAVAVVVGPGSWTGIRVGLAVAKAYSYLRQIPIIELRDTLDAKVAWQKFQKGETVTAFAAKPFYNGEFVVQHPWSLK